METRILGRSGRQTTQLGFGCSSIMGALGRRGSLAMLESAWDAGIRHFDVAPMYGYGEAEECLGEFLSRHRGQVTVTTKYGIPPPQPHPLKRLARSMARPVIQRFPAIKRRLAAAAGGGAPQETKSSFTAGEAKLSLERSLIALKTDHIDIWLLHEATADELRDEGLLRFLEDSVKAGTLGTFGVGSNRERIDDLVAHRAEYCPTLQFEWSILNPVPTYPNTFRIHHSSLTNSFRSLHSTLVADQDRRRRWSEQTNVDLSDSETLANLMLKAALVKNAESVILFSSKNPAHIRANVAVASDNALSVAANTLYRIVQEEKDFLLA